MSERMGGGLDHRPTSFTRRLTQGYDDTVNFDYFGMAEGSDFLNLGYWTRETDHHQEACENLMERLLAFVPEKDGRILDAGCGKGATTRHLLRYYEPENVTGINVSGVQLGRCRRNAPGCTFVLMDATHLEFDDDSFDTVICVEAAVHFDSRRRFLLEAERVLKPGGRLLLADVLLAPWAPMQPAGNFVPTPDDYKRGCLAAGFVDVLLVDATRECWHGLARHLFGYLHAALARDEIDREQFDAGMAWLRTSRASIQHYLLVTCLKGSKDGVESGRWAL
jgi:MPBQ/MSBQ methyltransferase